MKLLPTYTNSNVPTQLWFDILPHSYSFDDGDWFHLIVTSPLTETDGFIRIKPNEIN
ncbi:hypothetical protein 12VC501_gene0100 [Vibrio phage 12VC501]|nr:hypothetical protein 12VC501_gene0100 [Vibrio phage 12VC501]